MNTCCNCKMCRPITEFVICTCCGNMVWNCVEDRPFCEQCCNNNSLSEYNLGYGMIICENCNQSYINGSGERIIAKLKAHLETTRTQDEIDEIINKLLNHRLRQYSTSFSNSVMLHRERVDRKLREIKDRLEDAYIKKFNLPYGHIDRHLFKRECK